MTTGWTAVATVWAGGSGGAGLGAHDQTQRDATRAVVAAPRARLALLWDVMRLLMIFLLQLHGEMPHDT